MKRLLRTGLWLVLLCLLLVPAVAQDAASWEKKTPPLKTRWYDEVSPDNALPEYPRPQLARPDWQSLNGD